jgi:uncharacterized protein (DUF362 family)
MGQVESGPYTRPSPVYVERSDDMLQTLAGALGGAGLFERLGPGAGRSVAIKANIMGSLASDVADGTFTDPACVEWLVQALRERDFGPIAVVDSRISAAEGVRGVATRVGYRAAGYDIVDLSDETEPYDYGGVLGPHPVAPVWRDAAVRISFAKNKTHKECFYSGSMANVLGSLPEPDKRRWYRTKDRSAPECVRTALSAFPVHFGIVEAWTSRDSAGVRSTRSVLASENVVALDWVMGEKMGVDPALNPVVQEALHRWGRIDVVRRGDLMPWEPWDAPGDLTVALNGLSGARSKWTIQ